MMTVLGNVNDVKHAKFDVDHNAHSFGRTYQNRLPFQISGADPDSAPLIVQDVFLIIQG